jgi:hypothetical protein
MRESQKYQHGRHQSSLGFAAAPSEVMSRPMIYVIAGVDCTPGSMVTSCEYVAIGPCAGWIPKKMMLDIVLTSKSKLSGRPGCWTLITLPGSEVPILIKWAGLFPVGTRPENKAQSGSNVDP